MNVIPATATKAQAFKGCPTTSTESGRCKAGRRYRSRPNRDHARYCASCSQGRRTGYRRHCRTQHVDIRATGHEKYARPAKRSSAVRSARSGTHRNQSNQTGVRQAETDAAGNVTMPGRTYRELQSAIGKQMKSASGDLKPILAPCAKRCETE